MVSQGLFRPPKDTHIRVRQSKEAGESSPARSSAHGDSGFPPPRGLGPPGRFEVLIQRPEAPRGSGRFASALGALKTPRARQGPKRRRVGGSELGSELGRSLVPKWFEAPKARNKRACAAPRPVWVSCLVSGVSSVGLSSQVTVAMEAAGTYQQKQ